MAGQADRDQPDHGQPDLDRDRPVAVAASPVVAMGEVSALTRMDAVEGEVSRGLVRPAVDERERDHLRPAPRSPVPEARRPADRGPEHHVAAASDAADRDGGRPMCTVPQLRRFIKSRPWVPMHELRRRFGIAGTEDDVTPIRVGDTRLYIGLPAAEGRLMAELLAGGDVGYELSMDPTVPVVVGVYPMRPVPRA